jgi:hypothetical protein
MQYGESDVATVGDVTLKYYVEGPGVKICCYSESRVENRTQFSFFFFFLVLLNQIIHVVQSFNSPTRFGATVPF